MQILSDIIFDAAKRDNKTLLSFKKDEKWHSFSSSDFTTQILYLACALQQKGLRKNDRVAIFAYQNPLWLISDFAIMLAGGVSVPIFCDISKDNLTYEIKDSEAKFIFTDNPSLLPENNDLLIIDYNSNPNFVSFNEMLEIGKNIVQTQKRDFGFFKNINQPQDLATIIYTSGSTGKPKGVELTHQNLTMQIQATQICFPLQKGDRALSFLPLAHIFERMVMMFYITQNIEIYFVNDIKKIADLLQEIKPSLMTVVPRILEKIFARIQANIDNKNLLAKILAQFALQKAMKPPYCKINIADKILDILVYKKMRAIFGGNIKMLICGGAALSYEMENFYNNIGINLYCGYGLTEASPVIATNHKAAHKIGSVGRAFPGVELRIAQDNELLVRGTNVMRAYHNQPQKTAETIIDGWFYTGDLAQIDNDGFVKIIGRKKELFKTANGKYVCPIPIEQKLVQLLPFLLGAIIIAENRKFTSALLFPEFDALKNIKNKLKFLGDDEEFLKSKILNDYVQNVIELVNKGLNHAEQIQKFAVIVQKISIQSGEITPSMKLKRNVLEEKFKNIVEEFYK